MNPLAGWQNFYVIVGSSAGALIGLQFVTLSLISSLPGRRGNSQTGSAFATPTIIHFCAVLAIGACICAPWDGPGTAAIPWGGLGFTGLIYAIVVTRKVRGQELYRPEFEDWLFHSILPIAAYALVAGSACLALAYAREALFILAAAVLLLLFIGIHNAWDAVTYHVFVTSRNE